MSMWLYQLAPQQWPPTGYRFDIWENERWSWPVGRITAGGTEPVPGDTVVFFYSGRGVEGGFYGWAIVLRWEGEEEKKIHFRTVAPSDLLKMCPWNDAEAMKIADEVRGPVKSGTLWRVKEDLEPRIRSGIVSWRGIPSA